MALNLPQKESARSACIEQVQTGLVARHHADGGEFAAQVEPGIGIKPNFSQPFQHLRFIFREVAAISGRPGQAFEIVVFILRQGSPAGKG